jgi:hypothetical protein
VNISLNNINLLVTVMEMQCEFSEEETEFFKNIILMNVRFQMATVFPTQFNVSHTITNIFPWLNTKQAGTQRKAASVSQNKNSSINSALWLCVAHN